ncbi:MAG: helix-turn-helix domain-containing protein, partial [Rickettsiales bacterium]
MWGNNRKSEASRTGADGDSAASGTEPSNVGRYLKAQREARGEDIPHVADMLRIHRAYLQAIEENEIDKLPGPTYAVGFVRAYAEHLGLDSRQIVERFKEEGKVLDKRAQLVFPSPLPEGRVPSAAIMLLAFVFLLAAYGGWIYVSSSNDGGVDMVPSL